MDNQKLYHSDIYLGEIYNDGIKHWKYIDKEKVNGKWRYYYYKKEGPNKIDIYEKRGGNPNSKYGVYTHGTNKTIEFKKGKKLLTTTSRTHGAKFKGSYAIKTTHDVVEVGVLQQTLDKAKKKIDKGKKWLSRLFD